MLRKFRVHIAAVLVVAMLAVAGVTGAQATTPTVQDQIVSLVNAQRAAVHLPPLKHSPTIDAAAGEWASLMPVNPLVHSTAAWRAARIPAGWDTNGENIASGFGTAASVMTAWMQSPGHKANILRDTYTRIGVGYDRAGNRWVQIFAGYSGDRTFATTTPTVSGTVRVGAVLTATAASWMPAPDLFTYRWMRAGIAISGATSRSYRLTAADLGQRMTVAVRGTKTNYLGASRTSAATVGVARGILTTAVPTISGTILVGHTLGATTGVWGPAPVTFAYQWKRSGVIITGATASSYKLVAADLGQTITVTVRGKKAGYTWVSKTSLPTHRV